MKLRALILMLALLGLAGLARAQSNTGGGSGSGGVNPPGQPGAFPQFASYTVYISGGTVYARNNSTGAVDYSGADAAVVINSVVGALVNIGGTVFFKTGTYNFNSATQESTGGYSQFYSVGIPATNSESYPQFIFVGEQSNLGQNIGVGTGTPTTNGVVFNVTTAAETAAGASQLDAFWMRPNTSSAPGFFWNDQLSFKNISVQFPNNQRGSEIAIDALEASFASTDNVTYGFATIPTLAAAAGLIGLRSPATPSYGVYIRDGAAQGFETCYEINTEHSQLFNPLAFHCTNAYYYGKTQNRNAANVIHSSDWHHVQVYDSKHGIVTGTHILAGAVLNVDLDLEYIASGNWTFIDGVSEDTPGLSGGTIYWSSTLTNVGRGTITTPLKAAQGKNFIVVNTTNLVPRALSVSGTELTMSQSGDVDGLSALVVENRSGAAGFASQNFALPLDDASLQYICNISTVAVASNVLTVNCSNTMLVAYPVGKTLNLSGLTTATFLNAQVVTVASSTTSSFTASFTHANYGSASDTGTAAARANVRFETRSANLVNSGNILHGEFQFADPNDGVTTVPIASFGTVSSKLNAPTALPSYTVSTLPSASTVGAGSMAIVTDASTFTVGTCTGSGSDYMIAVSNGTTWSCH